MRQFITKVLVENSKKQTQYYYSTRIIVLYSSNTRNFKFVAMVRFISAATAIVVFTHQASGFVAPSSFNKATPAFISAAQQPTSTQSSSTALEAAPTMVIY